MQSVSFCVLPIECFLKIWLVCVILSFLLITIKQDSEKIHFCISSCLADPLLRSNDCWFWPQSALFIHPRERCIGSIFWALQLWLPLYYVFPSPLYLHCFYGAGIQMSSRFVEDGSSVSVPPPYYFCMLLKEVIVESHIYTTILKPKIITLRYLFNLIRKLEIMALV